MRASLLLATVTVLQSALAQYPNIRVSSVSSTTPEEVTIAINPTDASNLIAGANLRFFYYSTNSGQSWTQGQLPTGTWGDPCVIFDADGKAYYAHLSNPAAGYFIERLIVHRSTNGGRTWGDSVDVGYNPPKQQDKEWLAVDMTGSPYYNTVYMAWTEFDSYGSANPNDSSRILFSRSTNGGASWSAPLRLSDRGGNCIDSDSTVEGAVPAIGPNGEVYVSWSGPSGIMFDRSTDGGVTFGQDVFVTSHPGGWDFDVPGIYRCNGLPVTACDISNSPYRGHIYICWGDQRNGLDDTDVFLIKSTDGGSTWGEVRRVNNDLTNRHQFFPWMTIDQTTGVLWFVFYDRRNTTGNATDVYVAKSTDGGETFENFKVSQTPFTPLSSIFFGDYANIAAQDGKIYPIWMRMDGTSLSIWVAPFTDSVAVSVPDQPLEPRTYTLLQNYPNPFNPTTAITFHVASPKSQAGSNLVSLKVYDVLGREVATLAEQVMDEGQQEVVWHARGFASGLYLCRLIIDGQLVSTRKLMLLQ